MNFATTKERILQYINTKGISVAMFLKETGIKRGFLDGDKLKGAVSDVFLAKIVASYPELNINWLITGEGDMLKYEIVKEPTQAKKISLLQESINSYISDDIISIPIVDVSAAAGHGFFNHDHPEKLGELKFPIYMLKKRTGNYYCGRVNGESMSPTLLNQDFMIMRLLSFDEWVDLKDGEVYFIVDRSGTSYVKRVKNNLHNNGTIVCMSDNTDKANFRDFEVPGEDFANIYHVEWRFSKDMTNINKTYSNRLEALESDMESIKQILKNTGKI
ncbi:S24 family peptidase [Dysgonomonas sp. Marseille-P4361]|uniref:S24 family peptidase n=1 Tax=Dysgonomonas sp. Marseille-P4361 TaxID=2161820 RepID=UPI000D54AF2F|nr:S24 family peptidase [Dysgonomonas sp. Marseille-P4361]